MFHRRGLVAALLWLVTAWGATPGSAQEAHLALIRAQLQAELERVADGYEGVAGVHILDLTSGDRFAVRDDFVFPQASAIKVPILLELFRRAEAEPDLLGRRVELTDAVRTGGSGVLLHLTDGGSALSLEDYAIYMIVYSDNTATNVLIDELGMEAVNALSTSLGATSTKLQRKMIRPEQSAIGNENLSTPRDAALIMERIASCDLPMGAEGCRRVREILEIYKGGPIRAPVPREVPIAFKPGGITGVATAWGLVDVPDRPYVIAVMSNYGGNGGAVVEAVSAAAYRYFSRLSGITPYGARVGLDVKRRVAGTRGHALVPGWVSGPEEIGGVSGVASDADGTIYAFRRDANNVWALDPSGRLRREWGQDIARWTHSIRIDPQGNIWTVDGQGHQVKKWSPDARTLLLTLGHYDVAGDGPDTFNRPTDVAFAPNGDLFVSDGYVNTRVVKFDRHGNFLSEWGGPGTRAGEFDTVHSIVIDSRDRVLVADRGNARVQIFDLEGNYREEWTHLGTPYSLYLTDDDRLYIADGVNGRVWIADADDGTLLGTIEGTEGIHWVAVDPAGSVYAASNRSRYLRKYQEEGGN
ncbi:MAG: serine hydrolase [Gammaproteobacteria bacterium]|nr:serine hydrolase [Gammaproteobacteria bacterium]